MSDMLNTPLEDTMNKLEEDIPIIFYPSADAYEKNKQGNGVLITNALAITESGLYAILRDTILRDMSQHVNRIHHENVPQEDANQDSEGISGDEKKE